VGHPGTDPQPGVGNLRRVANPPFPASVRNPWFVPSRRRIVFPKRGEQTIDRRAGHAKEDRHGHVSVVHHVNLGVFISSSPNRETFVHGIFPVGRNHLHIRIVARFAARLRTRMKVFKCSVPEAVESYVPGDHGSCWCPGRELNPHSRFQEEDFKSSASADFATRAKRNAAVAPADASTPV
jgi:hypothetical protein